VEKQQKNETQHNVIRRQAATCDLLSSNAKEEEDEADEQRASGA
jgi:hypothetical protein